MLFALILEFPLSLYIYGEVNTMSILINSLFPPFLMVAILAFFRVPGEDNTKKFTTELLKLSMLTKALKTQVAFYAKKNTCA